MKIGDRIAVQMEGFDVAEAVIEDIEDGKATIVIPATRVVVGVRTSLDVSARPESGNPDRVFGGMEDNQPAISEAMEQVNQSTTTEPTINNADIGEGIHGKELDSSVLD